MERLRTASPYLLAALLGGSGLLHLVAPGVFEPLIPPFLGSPRAWVYGSGIAELVCAAALVRPWTRSTGALASGVLLVAVFPGNVWLAVEPGEIPLQVPLVLWALSLAGKFRSTGGRRRWERPP